MKQRTRTCSRSAVAVIVLAVAGLPLLDATRVEAAERGNADAATVRDPARSAESPPAHDHAHGDHDQDTAAIAPAGGWASDAPLRQGMQAILDAVVTAVDNDADGTTLAPELRAQITYLFTNCRLEPDADAALHSILAELLQSAQRLEGGANARAEHASLHAALQRYGQQFQHPGWPLR